MTALRTLVYAFGDGMTGWPAHWHRTPCPADSRAEFNGASNTAATANSIKESPVGTGGVAYDPAHVYDLCFVGRSHGGTYDGNRCQDDIHLHHADLLYRNVRGDVNILAGPHAARDHIMLPRKQK